MVRRAKVARNRAIFRPAPSPPVPPGKARAPAWCPARRHRRVGGVSSRPSRMANTLATGPAGDGAARVEHQRVVGALRAGLGQRQHIVEIGQRLDPREGGMLVAPRHGRDMEREGRFAGGRHRRQRHENRRTRRLGRGEAARSRASRHGEAQERPRTLLPRQDSARCRRAAWRLSTACANPRTPRPDASRARCASRSKTRP